MCESSSEAVCFQTDSRNLLVAIILYPTNSVLSLVLVGNQYANHEFLYDILLQQVHESVHSDTHNSFLTIIFLYGYKI